MLTSIDVKFTFDSARLGLFSSTNILQIADVVIVVANRLVWHHLNPIAFLTFPLPSPSKFPDQTSLLCDWLTCLSSRSIPNEHIFACSNWIVGSITNRCSKNEFMLIARKSLRGAYPTERHLSPAFPGIGQLRDTKCGGTKLIET